MAAMARGPDRWGPGMSHICLRLHVTSIAQGGLPATTVADLIAATLEMAGFLQLISPGRVSLWPMEDALAFDRIGATNVLVVRGDVTRQPVEGVVNAANESLQHGGGVAQAIVRTGGRVIQEESDAWIRDNGLVGRGQAAVTTGGMLIASHVIHVVGPIYREGQDNPAILRDAVFAALDAAQATELRSLAFPAISAGIYGYPAEEATQVIAQAVVNWLHATPNDLVEVRLVGFNDEISADFASALTATKAA